MNPKQPSKRQLAFNWLTLVVLHFVILGTAFLNLSLAGTPIILTLAVVQTVLVMSYFMEVRYCSRLIGIFSVAGFFWLLIQWTLTMSDYLTRQWH